MYANDKSRVSNGKQHSDYFMCRSVVRQGENLESKNTFGINSLTTEFGNELYVYIHILTLLYAYDTVILAESEHELQHVLDVPVCKTYRHLRSLKVNIVTTIVLCFL